MNENAPDTATGENALPPDGWTLFNFLDVADLLHERVGAALAEVGLSYPKYEVLAHLHDDGGAVTLGALAEGQKCARSNITQMIDRLEAENLVRRVPDPTDRRSVLAQLTPEGSELAARGAARLDRLRIEFAAGLSPDDRRTLDQLLAKLR